MKNRIEWVLALALACRFAAGAPASGEPAALGSPTFRPSPERPVGWRGDGTGRYTGAKPPLTWERRPGDSGYTTKNILWSVRLPDWSVASPIVVGDRIFVTAEPGDLVCLDKRSGRILWIRSNTDCEGIPEAERAATPAYAEKVAPLIARLAATNEAVVTLLNAFIAPAGVPEAGRATISATLKARRDLQGEIHKALLAVDKKKYDRYWAQAIFGFSGPTPCSDGSRVCAFFTTGITVCYDLEGRRLWIHHGRGSGSEHGNFASPLLADGKVVVWAHELRGYDVATGTLLWTAPAKGSNNYGSMFRIDVGKEIVAGYQFGFFVRLRDGALIWNNGCFGDATATPIVESGTVFAWVGYPRNSQGLGFKAFTVPPATDSGALKARYTFDTDWGVDELANADKKHPFDRSFVASPLYVDGLIYQLTEGGGLVVSDAQTGRQVYRKVLGLSPRTAYWNWAGASASPTLAGQHIFLMDNQGTTIVIRPGPVYREEARNALETSAAREQEQNLTTPVFEGERMYYRGHEYLYCIGEKPASPSREETK